METRSTIIRKSTSGYTIVPNILIKDNTLSLRARGLFAYMISFPEDWVFYKSTLHKDLMEGRDAVKQAFNELIHAGWITVVQRSSIGGKFIYTYELHVKPVDKANEPVLDDSEEVTVTEKPSTVNLQTVTEKPSTVNQSLYKDYKQNTIINKDVGVKSDFFKQEDSEKYNQKIDDFHQKSISDEIWMENFCMQTKLDIPGAKTWLEEFVKSLKSTQEPMVRLQEFRRYATHWTTKEISKNTAAVRTGFNVDQKDRQPVNPIKPAAQPSLKYRSNEGKS